MLIPDPNIRRIEEWVWVAADGEFIRERVARHNWPLRFQDGKQPRFIQRRVEDAPNSAAEYGFYPEEGSFRFVHYEVRKFSSAAIGKEPQPITNIVVREELLKLERYVRPRAWPTIRFYVDPLIEYQVYRIKPEAQVHGQRWCHLFSKNAEQDDLHEFAAKLGLKRSWFQPHRILWHYDLTPAKRLLAVRLGAVDIPAELRFEAASAIYRARKAEKELTG